MRIKIHIAIRKNLNRKLTILILTLLIVSCLILYPEIFSHGYQISLLSVVHRELSKQEKLDLALDQTPTIYTSANLATDWERIATGFTWIRTITAFFRDYFTVKTVKKSTQHSQFLKYFNYTNQYELNLNNQDTQLENLKILRQNYENNLELYLSSVQKSNDLTYLQFNSSQIYSNSNTSCPEIPEFLMGDVTYFETLPENFTENCEFMKTFSNFVDLYRLNLPSPEIEDFSSRASNLVSTRNPQNKQMNWPPKLHEIQAAFLPYLNNYKSKNYNQAIFEPQYYFSASSSSKNSCSLPNLQCQTPAESSTIAIIICFRDRYQHLSQFLTHMLPILIRQQLKFKIYLIEQTHEKAFNRAKLFNIGYDIAKKDPTMEGSQYDCFTFHDIDLLLLNDEMLYRCNYDKHPRHLIVDLENNYDKIPYDGLFGGAVQLDGSIFEQVNGYSNSYFGWGGEDDDLSMRLFDFNSDMNFNLIRPDKKVAKYRMIEHKSDLGNKRNANRFRLLRDARNRWATDGLNNLNYEIVDQTNFGVFMRYTVNL